ncbi:MAG: HAD-IA family hydrolase [Duncaniella sp.]|nr:HAD-IA family hydrolase [Duncaniella sp.]
MKRIKNLIFDFDGTLADTSSVIISTMQAAIGRLGLPERTDEECASMIGLRLEEIPAVLWPGLPVQSKEFAATYREIFDRRKDTHGVELFPGVGRTLDVLSRLGFGMAIASSRSHRSLDEYVERLGMGGVFSLVVGGNDVAYGKPAPDAVLSIADRMGWNPAETMVVGDARFDILMGRNAGTETCAVSYGNQSREELAESCPGAIVDRFASILPIACGVDSGIVEYVEANVLPRYSEFDKAHREDHAMQVIGQSMELAGSFPGADIDMIYVVAAFHDLGLAYGRERHHIDSGKMLVEDPMVKSRFSEEQIETMRQAVEDHRASKGSCPRNDYGLIVAEADRFIDPETIVRRTIQYGLANYPELDTEGHYRRMLRHLIDKYGPDGYLKIRIPDSPNVRRLARLRTIISSEETLRRLFDRILREETEG